ncbi:MAG: hypothetical protein OHK0022_40200 [Roseiflexaceae bacterium]
MVCMAHRKFQLTEREGQALLAAYLSTTDGAYRTRLQAVRLYGLGYSCEEITTITGVPRSSLMSWCQSYRQGGIEELDDHRAGGNSAKLTPAQVAEIKRTLQLYTPHSLFGPLAATPDGQAWTVDDLRRLVQDHYNLTYQSVVSYYNLFQRCGFSYHKPAKVYKSRNEVAVMEFETQLEKNCSTWHKALQRR